MNEQLRIGAKFLASMVLPGFCPRCYWYRLHGGNPPFSSFPGIFNDIDLFTKRLVEANIDKNGHPPAWLGSFAKAVGYKHVGFLDWVDEENSILMRGGPDAVFYGENELQWFVGDYKTARYTSGQDRFLPQYKVQLLAYAYLLQKNGYKKPDHAALFYFGPPADPTFQESLASTKKTGFVLPMIAEVVDIELGKFKQIDDLLRQTREIYDLEDTPEGLEGCKDCRRLDQYFRLARHDTRPKRKSAGVDSYTDFRGKKRFSARYVDADDFEILSEDDGEWFPGWAGQ